MGYSTQVPIHQVDHHALLFTVICLPGWTGGFLQIMCGYWNARRDKIAGLPIAMTVGMLVHDSVFVVRFHYFFHNVGNLYWELYCVGAVFSVMIELVLVWQWLRYSAGDLRGDIPQAVFNAICLVTLLSAYAVFLFSRRAVHDPLDLYGTVIVQNAAVLPLVPWILSRRSARGQSRLFAFGTLIGPACGGLLQPIFLSPSFRSWELFLLMGATTALAIIYWRLYEHFAAADQVGAGSPESARRQVLAI